MKKGIVVIFMAAIIAVYFFSVRSKVDSTQQEEPEISAQLTEYKEKLEKAYPNSIEQVIESNNQLMKIQYSKEMLPEYVELVVDASRLLYSQPLLDLNTRQDQIDTLFKDTLETSVSEMYILSSTVDKITYHEEDLEAKVLVKYYTTIVDFQREYELIQEDGMWKIYRWEDSALTAQSLQKED